MPVSGARTVLMWSLVLLRMACLALNSARRDPIQGVNIYRQLDEWKLERSTSTEGPWVPCPDMYLLLVMRLPVAGYCTILYVVVELAQQD